MKAREPIDLSALVLDHPSSPDSSYPDIVTFAEHPGFAGDSGPGLFPRQQTLLRPTFCDLENMTSYDHDVIDEWRDGFHLGAPRDGESPMTSGGFYSIGSGPEGAITSATWSSSAEGARVKGIWVRSWSRTRVSAPVWLGDPQAHYGLAQGKHLRTQIMATNYEQARDNMSSRICSRWLRMPLVSKDGS